MQDEKSAKVQVQPTAKRWYKRWWAWCLWVLLALLLILFAVGLWAWNERYTLLEGFAVDILAESGFDADLDIVSITRTRAVVRNIRLRRDGTEVLHLEGLSADYVWPDVRDGQLLRLDVAGVKATLNVGEDWKPTDEWLIELLASAQSSSSDSNEVKAGFPENGIGLSDGSLVLNSPLGQATLYLDVDMPNEEDFTSEITLAPSDLSYGGFAAKGAGVASVIKTGSALRLIGQTQSQTLSNTQLVVKSADLQFDGTLDLDTKAYLGSVSLDGDSLSGELIASGPARLAWDGQVIYSDDLNANGTWSISAENARSPRPARAMEVAETLSLFPTLSVVPVTEHYAPELRDMVQNFIVGADVAGQGRLEYGVDGFTINPVGKVSIKSPDNHLLLSPRSGRNFYAFDKVANIISAQMDAQFDHPVSMTLKNINLEANSSNGVRLDGIRDFSADLKTQEDWEVTGEDGAPVRLGPLLTSLTYAAQENPRRLSINTDLDYDGDLPGGRVTGLNLEGRLDVRLYDGRQVLDFTPRSESRITLAALETPTAWVGENISFNLPPTKSLFTRTASKTTLAATLETADFTLIQPAIRDTAAQRLELQSAGLELEGFLHPDQTQDWTVAFTDVDYASETLPGPGTTGAAQLANLTAHLAPGSSPQITLRSPAMTGETPLARLSNFEIELSGTPDKYKITHKGGTVDVIGSEFATAAEAAGVGSFPADGSVEFVGGRFVGTAHLVVAKADDADMTVAYEYANGAGSAEIDIPSIIFAPQGLQPQTLVPAFRGKVARVEGEARAKMNIGFANGELTRSSGIVQLVEMDVGTAPGPISGLNTTMRFKSLWPLETDGQQTLTMDSFNPGLALEDGTVVFHFVPEGVKVASADWPFGKGSFSLDPFTWVYAAEENRVTMRVIDVGLGDFLNDLGNKKVQATGRVVGEFPIVIRGIEVLIEDGKIAVPDGGIIEYDPGPGAVEYSEEEAIAVLREQRSGEYAALAQDALRKFRYRELSASLDGPLEGDVEIGLIFDGSNEKVLNQQPFKFDISVRGELFNIARSFNSNAQVKSEILRQNGQLPEGTIIGE